MSNIILEDIIGIADQLVRVFIALVRLKVVSREVSARYNIVSDCYLGGTVGH